MIPSPGFGFVKCILAFEHLSTGKGSNARGHGCRLVPVREDMVDCEDWASIAIGQDRIWYGHSSGIGDAFNLDVSRGVRRHCECGWPLLSCIAVLGVNIR